MRDLLAGCEDAGIRRALGLAPDRETYARLWRALCAATEGEGEPEAAVVTTIFAMPLVIVTGARQRTALAGTVGDVEALADHLARAGALGASRNFGLSNALCSLETLEGMPPSTVFGWRAGATPGARAIEPEPVAVRAGEEVHLRFLLGAAVVPATAPSVAETAAHIGAWGMSFTRELGAQLAVPGVELLAFPRPPAGVLRAAYRGRCAQLDAALNLFLSNAIKRARAASGEPSLVISAHAGAAAELRVSLSAVLDDTLLEGFRRPLHPLDDLEELVRSVERLAADCRLTDVRLVQSVLPEGGEGAQLFVRASDAPVAGRMLS
jgi:hypothetical protein